MVRTSLCATVLSWALISLLISGCGSGPNQFGPKTFHANAGAARINLCSLNSGKLSPTPAPPHVSLATK